MFTAEVDSGQNKGARQSFDSAYNPPKHAESGPKVPIPKRQISVDYRFGNGSRLSDSHWLESS